MNIYIPTLGRLETQLTWDLLPDFIRDRTLLVVPPDEVTEHFRRGRAAIACPETGIAKVREWIIHFARDHGDNRIGVLDDDITEVVYTSRHRDLIPGLPWQTAITLEDWTRVLAWIESSLDRTSTCGLADGTMHPVDADEVSPGRLMRNHFYNLDTLPIDTIDWSGIRYAEDFHVTLQLIALGQPNVINNRYRVMSIATQRPGGCSAEDRNVETHNAAMRRLINHHAPWVRQSNKKRKGHEDWIKVNIRWQAYWKHIRQEQGR